MTTTQIRPDTNVSGDPPDTVGLTVEERGAGLLRMAELALRDDFPTPALPAVVAHLASPAVLDVQSWFEALVDAVRDQQRYNEDPRGFALVHEWPTSERSLDCLDQQLAANVTTAVWSLLHPAPACVHCQRSGRLPSRWNQAEWPRSVFCADHGGETR